MLLILILIIDCFLPLLPCITRSLFFSLISFLAALWLQTSLCLVPSSCWILCGQALVETQQEDKKKKKKRKKYQSIDHNAWNGGRRSIRFPLLYVLPWVISWQEEQEEPQANECVLRLVANNFWGKEDAGVGPMLDRMHHAKTTCDELKNFYTRTYCRLHVVAEQRSGEREQ